MPMTELGEQGGGLCAIAAWLAVLAGVLQLFGAALAQNSVGMVFAASLGALLLFSGWRLLRGGRKAAYFAFLFGMVAALASYASIGARVADSPLAWASISTSFLLVALLFVDIWRRR